VKVAIVVCVNVPFVAVIVTWNVPGTLLLQESVAVCDVVPNVIVDGLIALHVRPDCTASLKDMVLANPLLLVRVIVKMEETPGLAITGEEVVIVKSITLNVIVF
jgi:hypothetical protein